MTNSDFGTRNGVDQEFPEPEIYAFPCSLGQSRFWVMDQITPGDPALNVAVRWRLHGRLDAATLQLALSDVVERHEILRTSYRDVDGEPEQLILPEAPLQLPVIDLTLLPERARLEERERISFIEACKPFDLAAVPSLRATLLKVDAEEHVILVTVHHIASDGWSIGVIARDMMEFYEARLRNRTPQLPDLPLQYADFAAWQNEWLQVNDFKAERAYWTRNLADFRFFRMPPDKPRVPGDTPAMIAGRQLPRKLTDAMSALAAAEGCTFFVVGASALFSLLYRRTGQEDITVGTQITGRDRVELNDIIGPFINTVPLRANLGGMPTFRQMMERMQDVIEGALLNQQMPLEDIVSIVKPARDPDRPNPLFAVNLICQRSFIPTDVKSELTLIDMPSVSPGALYDLNFFYVERPDGWRVSCEYNAALFEGETVNAYLEELQALLEEFIANPDRQITSGVAVQAPLPSPLQFEPKAPEVPSLTRVGVEAQLADIWVGILKVPILNKKDDFFALGGHSLSAFRMLSRIEKTFGKRVSFEELNSHPTIGGLAKLLLDKLQEGEEAQSGNAVAMQPLGSRTPVFAIQDTFIYQELVNHLGDDQPFFAVPLPAYVEGEPEISYGELAEYCVRAIREARPNGPYVLVGFCAAARLAVGVARRLTEQGQKVELLVTLDTWAPGIQSRMSKLRRFLSARSYQAQMAVYYVASFFKGPEGRRHAIRRIRLFLEARFDLKEKSEFEKAEEARYNRWQQEVAGPDETVPLAVPILVVHNEDMPLRFLLDKTMGWRALTSSDVIMAQVPGTHEELIRRTASGVIADKIRANLEPQSGG